MRNRTAIRLLYLLAVLAGILPPVLFVAYAYRQGMREIESKLDFVGEGALARAELVLDSASATVRKVAALTQGRVDDTTLATLRQAVFLDRFVQAVGIRRGNTMLCTSEQPRGQPIPIPDPQLAPLPAPGLLQVLPPAERGFPAKSLILVYAFAPDMAVEGYTNPETFNEFYEDYARESGSHVLEFFDDGRLLTDFGNRGILPPPGIDLMRTSSLQWHDGMLAWVARSEKYPIYTVTVTNAGQLLARWSGTVLGFAAAGGAVSALLSGLLIRVARRTRSLEADLREAVRYEEIDVHYQPLMNLETGRCVGAEALMRWRHPRRGMIPAGEFIDVAEKTDLIVPMTESILQKIASSAGPLLQADPSLHIGINLAPQHFTTTRLLDVVDAVRLRGLPAGQLIFEITERGLVADTDSVAHTVMAGLSATGAKLAVDDFGTGYSSLSYLQRFPLDYLKIDKAFVDGIESETASSGLVDQIIRIANSLGMEIIAEGVEQPFQATYLRMHGVRIAQGWHFAKPMPAAEFEEFVRTRNSSPGPHPAATGS